MKKILSVLLAVIIVAGLFTGCASKSEAASTMMGDGRSSIGVSSEMVTEETAAPAADYEYTDEAAEKEAGLSTDFDADAIINQSERKLIYQAYYSIETTEFDADYAFILSKLSAISGYAQNTSVDGTKPTEFDDPGRYANLSLRIPVSAYNEFLTSLEGVGSIISKSQYVDDVSAQYIDTESRIRILNTQLDQLELLMAKAEKIEDIIVLEQEISDVMYELDQYEGQMRQLDNLIDYTTVTIYLSEVNEISTISSSEKGLGQRISDGFADVFDWMVRFFEGLLILIVAGSPVWIVVGIIVFVVIRLSKRSKRRKAANQEKK